MSNPVFSTLFLALCLIVAMPLSAADPAWIDVRTPEEFAAGHVEGAINIPYTEIVDRIGEVTSDKDAMLYLYCRSGRRSGIAADALEQAGFTGAVNIGGLGDAQEKAASLNSG
jgi:phage shock protein E